MWRTLVIPHSGLASRWRLCWLVFLINFFGTIYFVHVFLSPNLFLSTSRLTQLQVLPLPSLIQTNIGGKKKKPLKSENKNKFKKKPIRQKLGEEKDKIKQRAHKNNTIQCTLFLAWEDLFGGVRYRVGTVPPFYDDSI